MKVINFRILNYNSLVRENAEQEMREWVEEFMEEVQKVEIFFNTKHLEYQHELDMLKEAFTEKE